MDWEHVIAYVIESVCGVIISIGIPMMIARLSEKVKNEKINYLISSAGDIVCKCVAMIDQTYVDALKADGKFTKECQKSAFNMCKNNVLSLLNEESKKAVIDMFGDLESWVEVAIEASVRDNAAIIE